MKNSLKIELPEEFINLCSVNCTNPEEVLRGFIADVSQIMNWASDPREDGYSSNGSDERRLAWEYFERVGYPYRQG